MLAYKFETEVSESGLVRIPAEILDKIKSNIVEVIIFQDEPVSQNHTDTIRSLMGKYKGCLSTTDEFSESKALEKEIEL